MKKKKHVGSTDYIEKFYYLEVISVFKDKPNAVRKKNP